MPWVLLRNHHASYENGVVREPRIKGNVRESAEEEKVALATWARQATLDDLRIAARHISCLCLALARSEVQERLEIHAVGPASL